jgi:hypothetical protein
MPPSRWGRRVGAKNATHVARSAPPPWIHHGELDAPVDPPRGEAPMPPSRWRRTLQGGGDPTPLDLQRLPWIHL